MMWGNYGVEKVVKKEVQWPVKSGLSSPAAATAGQLTVPSPPRESNTHTGSASETLVF